MYINPLPSGKKPYPAFTPHMLPRIIACIITGAARQRILYMIVICMLTAATGSGQPVFQLGEKDSFLLRTFISTHEQRYRQTLDALPAAYTADYKKQYGLRWDNVKNKFNKGEIYTAAYAREYLGSIVSEITRSNPMLADTPFSCYFSRSGVPNASYLGEGVILLNMGLFYRLANESQAAFVICHELAHLYLTHSERSINNYVQKIHSPEVQRELKDIKKKEYRKRAQYESLLEGLSFDTRRHGREFEMEADSMAAVLLANTGFDIAESLTALDLLDDIDTDSMNTAEVLKKIFDTQSYPFQQRWLAKEEGLLGGHARLSTSVFADSLKTHPDCPARIQALQPAIKSYAREGMRRFVVDSLQFERLRLIFPYEITEFSYSSGNYGRSLYYTLELLQQHPGDPYLVAHTGKLLNGLYAAMKEHRLSRVAENPSPSYSPSYNQLLQFIQNLYPENIAALSYHFLKRYEQRLSNYEPYKDAYQQSIRIVSQ